MVSSISSLKRRRYRFLLVLLSLFLEDGAFAFSRAERWGFPQRHIAFSETRILSCSKVASITPSASALFSVRAPTAGPDSVTDTRPQVKGGFIDTELRGAAMRLHTKSQAPKEGQAAESSASVPYVPTLDDYLAFLVDSKHVYEALEDAVQCTDDHPELASFQNTGLERTAQLEQDIRFLVNEYDLVRPPVGSAGLDYAAVIRRMVAEKEGTVPEFMCHYYNFYFAHTAGGRMIGKKMAALLLNKRTLEFYKWDGDLNQIKNQVKSSIEDLAATWTADEREACVSEVGPAFKGGGALNAYLMGGQAGHD